MYKLHYIEYYINVTSVFYLFVGLNNHCRVLKSDICSWLLNPVIALKNNAVTAILYFFDVRFCITCIKVRGSLSQFADF